MIKVCELVKTVLFDNVKVGNDILSFKVEVYQDSNGNYSSKLMRKEFYRLQPSFLQADGLDSSDESFFVIDEHTLIEIDNIAEDNAEQCIEKVLELLKNKFEIV